MKRIIIVLIVSILFLTGCDSHQEINELGIVSALGIEKDKDNNQFIISAQLVNIKKSNEGANNSSSNIVTFTEKGNTIFEALRKITTKSSKKLYYAHMKIVIFDENVINDSQDKIIDFLTRDSESMINYFIFVSTENKPSEILEVLTPFEDIPAEYIVKLLKTSEKSYGNTYSLSFENYLDNLTTKGKNPAFTKISLKKSKDDEENMDTLKTTTSDYLKLGNILVHDKNSKLIELDDNESLSFNILSNNIINAIITLPCEDKFFTIEIINSSTKIKFNEKEKELTSTTNMTVSISDYLCEYSLSDKNALKKLSNQVKEHIETINNDLFESMKKYENDFIGIGLHIKENHKNYFDFNKENWDKDGLPNIKFSTKANIEFEKRGNALNLVKEKD